MKLKDWLVGIPLLIVPCVMAWFLAPAPAPSFQRVEEARIGIQACEFYCIGDRADGQMDSGFFVSREPVCWADLNDLTKAGPLGPGWKGKVWVSRRSGQAFAAVLPDNVEPRIWGRLCAFGDDKLLTDIENALRGQRG